MASERVNRPEIDTRIQGSAQSVGYQSITGPLAAPATAGQPSPDRPFLQPASALGNYKMPLGQYVLACGSCFARLTPRGHPRMSNRTDRRVCNLAKLKVLDAPSPRIYLYIEPSAISSANSCQQSWQSQGNASAGCVLLRNKCCCCTRHKTAWLAVDWVNSVSAWQVDMGWPDIHWLARDLGWAGGSHCLRLDRNLSMPLEP